MSGIAAGTVFALNEMIRIKPNQITSRALFCAEQPHANATRPEYVLYAMDQGETISSETAQRPKLIYVLEGELHMLVEEQPCRLTAGSSVWVQGDSWHEFAALSSCKFIQISI